MSDINWLTVLSRITPQAPIDLDDESNAAPAPVIDPGQDGPPPSTALWSRDETSAPAVGIRVTTPVADPMDLAQRLAAASVERGIYPVILSTLPRCGLERFGFRVERLLAGDAVTLARQEAELAKFWNFAIVVDAADIGVFR
ncbi:MAG: hypothetical protein ACRCSU_10685 [Paracoccaceae bacterium]